jgi:hypothetical protein
MTDAHLPSMLRLPETLIRLNRTQPRNQPSVTPETFTAIAPELASTHRKRVMLRRCLGWVSGTCGEVAKGAFSSVSPIRSWNLQPPKSGNGQRRSLTEVATPHHPSDLRGFHLGSDTAMKLCSTRLGNLGLEAVRSGPQQAEGEPPDKEGVNSSRHD